MSANGFSTNGTSASRSGIADGPFTRHAHSWVLVALMLSGHLLHIARDDGVDHGQRLSFRISPQGFVETDGTGRIAKGFEAHAHGGLFQGSDINHGLLQWHVPLQRVGPIAVALVKRVLAAP